MDPEHTPTTKAEPPRTMSPRWMAELDRYAASKGYGPPPLSGQTGIEFWVVDFHSGKTPQAALDEAEADGLAFGADYLEPEGR